MSPFSPVFALSALAVALGTVSLMRWPAVTPAGDGRYASIDGLRGYLAFCVFLHHAAVWYAYLRTGAWTIPPSRLYTQLGQSGVSLFFMITGLLFFSKLLGARHKPLDWTRLYVARVLRLTPLYLVAIALLGVIVARLSNFSLHEPPGKLIAHVSRWLTFTILGGPPVNTVVETSNAIAQVTWSLSYEWLFYLALPLLALSVGVMPPIPYLLLGGLSVAGMIVLKFEPIRLWAFAGGFIAALVIRNPSLTKHLRGAAAAVVACACLAAAVLLFPPANRQSPMTLALLTVAFVIVAAGNDLLGVLSATPSRRLGEVSYSIYLLHGLVLFTAFRFVIGPARAAALPAWGHWAVVLACTPFLVVLCCGSYRFIELPPMRWTPLVSQWLEARLPRRRAAESLSVLRRAS
jgi:peptidoglycan/LPS O-acetylase OafA/YrhL